MNMSLKNGWLYIGDDHKFRYALGKPGKNNLLIIGINPSTATPEKPDPTIRKMDKISKTFGYDGWIMINLCAVRTPKPDDLPEKLDKNTSNKNIDTIAEIQKNFRIGAVYAAWGTNIEKRSYLIDECQKISDVIDTKCWYSRGLTKYGHPRHPLYVPYAEKMKPFAIKSYIKSF